MAEEKLKKCYNCLGWVMSKDPKDFLCAWCAMPDFAERAAAGLARAVSTHVCYFCASVSKSGLMPFASGHRMCDRCCDQDMPIEEALEQAVKVMEKHERTDFEITADDLAPPWLPNFPF